MLAIISIYLLNRNSLLFSLMNTTSLNFSTKINKFPMEIVYSNLYKKQQLFMSLKDPYR